MTDLPDYDDPKLTPQEEWLVRCAAKGEWWEPSAATGNPVSRDGWDASRVLRASVIRFLAAGGIWPTRLAPWPVHAKGLMVGGAWIWGDLDLEGATLTCTLWLQRCAFDGPVNLMDARTKTVSFAGSQLPHLDAQRARIDGSLYLNEGFSAKGEVSLVGATIEGQLDCSKGNFGNPGGTALNANAVTAGASVFLRNGFSASGEVRLVRATIEGQLDCSNGSFDKPGGTALDADALTVGADVFLRAGFSAKGEVNLSGATIEGQLDCGKGSFDNPGGTALNADTLTVAASVFLRQGFSANGTVDFIRASVGGNMRCNGGTFDNPTGDALDLTLAEIGAGLFLHDLKAPEGAAGGMNGRLLLSQARCRVFRDDKKSWPAPDELVLDGFTYERLDDCPVDWESRRDWLTLQSKDHRDENFRPQPWLQAIKVLHDMGHDRDARNLGIAFEKARAARSSTKWYWRRWHQFTFYTVGCGYRPEWAALWSAWFISFGWLTFATAANMGFMAPRDGSVVAYLAAKPRAEIPEDYTKFNALVFAADAYLPVIELGQDLSWEPSPEQHGGVRPLAAGDDGWTCASRLLRGGNSVWQKPKTLARSCGYPQDPRWQWLTGSLHWLFSHGFHRVVYWADEILGWTFISLFIAGMSGLMKKE